MLSAVERQWQKEKALALPTRETLTPDRNRDRAKFQSDRARAVEKESRARKSDLGRLGLPLPRPAEDTSQTSSVQSRKSEAAQWIDDPSISFGAENLLNTSEARFYSFYSRMYDTVGPIWRGLARAAVESNLEQRSRDGEYTTQVDVAHRADGTFSHATVTAASGTAEFDRIAADCWRRAGAFPNPPRDLIGPDGLIHTGWTFKVYVGAQWGALERSY